MMQLSADAIWLATAAVDMRTGIDGLLLHVLAPPAPGPVLVAAGGRRVLADKRGTMALTGRRRGLAAPVGTGAGPVALVTT